MTIIPDWQISFLPATIASPPDMPVHCASVHGSTTHCRSLGDKTRFSAVDGWPGCRKPGRTARQTPARERLRPLLAIESNRGAPTQLPPTFGLQFVRHCRPVRTRFRPARTQYNGTRTRKDILAESGFDLERFDIYRLLVESMLTRLT